MEDISMICDSNEKAHVLLSINYTDNTFQSNFGSSNFIKIK